MGNYLFYGNVPTLFKKLKLKKLKNGKFTKPSSNNTTNNIMYDYFT